MTKNFRLLIKSGLAALVFLLLLLLPGLSNKINAAFDDVYSSIRGELEPDSNIVLIKISRDDIKRIGPWPIKRNYYALLINELTKRKVRKIGLEVFLSSRMITQTIYDNLLRKEIEKSGRVVLSSVAGQVFETEYGFYTDSLSFPSPKLLNLSLSTGHLNYNKNDLLTVPLNIKSGKISEGAFSYKISGLVLEDEYIAVNFTSSWKKFKQYNLIEFSELVYNQSRELEGLKDKIVIIGISDPQIASVINTVFDDELPGIALHAFAVDNLLKSRYLNTNFYIVSILLFALFLIVILIAQERLNNNRIYFYSSIGAAFIIISFSLYTFFYLKLSLSFFLLPFIVLVLTDLFSHLYAGKKALEGIIDEREILKSLLANKETELAQLQNEINTAHDENSDKLLNQIKSLEADIKKLKENEEDRTSAVVKGLSEAENFFGIIYKSGPMANVIELIRKAAPTDTTILVIGESGTGKELVAKAIHSLSSRKDENFIAVNCGALSENLLESELFGHVRGAFTGASADKQGRFEIADRGTIFLDEIGETSENFQVKLLRVLQTGEIEKVGSSQQYKVNVRVVAATNKELDTLVKERRFREDLYYRLNVLKIDLPPLRERKEDIEILAAHFLEEESESIKLSKAALQALIDFDWKGNVRELESAIKRGVILAQSERRELIQLSDLPNEIVKESKFSFEDLVLESLRSKNFSHSSVTETAKELGNVNRTLISENFRGIVFRTLCEYNFDIEKVVEIISHSPGEDIKEKVRSKVQTYITNIEKDISKTGEKDFNTVKEAFISKYKNLPVKFHRYLDEFIKMKVEK